MMYLGVLRLEGEHRHTTTSGNKGLKQEEIEVLYAFSNQRAGRDPQPPYIVHGVISTQKWVGSKPLYLPNKRKNFALITRISKSKCTVPWKKLDFRRHSRRWTFQKSFGLEVG
jgi:hypothetical protein